MLAQARRPVVQRPRATSASLPAPIGGWNARDALGDMAATDAVYLTNWFHGTTDVMVRGGHTHWATGLPDQVESLLVYAGGASNKLFAASGSGIYDVTAGGAVGAAAVSSLTNVRIQYQNVSTAGGDFMLCVNGANKLRGYNGSTWWVDGDGAHDITGLDTAGVIQINLFKNRIWFVQNNSLTPYYLGTSSIAGAAVAFPLQGIAQMGGYVVAMGTWTIDAGSGVDDLAVFVTNKGEIIVYKGTDPASASTWALVGVWRLGAPVGRRCLFKYAGDLLVISQDGLLPLSSALQSSRINPKVALTDKIQFAVSTAVTSYGDNFGWQTFYYPKNNQLYLNVPVLEGSTQQQYVMNTITKNWCNFEGWNANCWELYEDQPYFGGDTFVGLAYNGNSDNGDNIDFDGKQAFNYFGSRGLLKRWTMMRPIIQSSGIPSLLANINVDFEEAFPTSAISYTPQQYGVWDVSTWDTAIWTGGLSISKSWKGVNGVGYCAAVRLVGSSQGIDTHWVSTDLVMEKGGIL